MFRVIVISIVNVIFVLFLLDGLYEFLEVINDVFILSKFEVIELGIGTTANVDLMGLYGSKLALEKI